jgi:hypothetical protein
MGDNNAEDRETMPEDVPSRRSGRVFSLAAVVGIVLVLLLAYFFRDRIPGPWRSEDMPDNPFPAGALSDYVPEDSEAVLVVNLQALQETPAGRRLLAPALNQLIGEKDDRFDWIDCLGVDPLSDLDSLQISFAPSRGEQPLWLARGRFDPSRFQIGPGKLQKKTVDHFRVWEYSDRQTKRVTGLAPVGDALVASETPSRLIAALKQASNPRPISVRDGMLRELLVEVDRRQGVWLVASLRKLGPAARMHNFLLESILNPFFSHAESVHGGLTCAADVRAEFHFRTPTEESAAKLEMELNSLAVLAQGAPVLWSQEKELLPLFRLLAAGKTSREGTTVSLRCRLAGDELGE